MRFIVYGAGAIGGVVGARLFQSGHDVVLIARGEHLRAIQSSGLTLQAPSATVTLTIRAVGLPAEIEFRSDDVVFLAMKTNDTEAAVAELVAAAGPEIPVICLQNGVESERVVTRRMTNVYATPVRLPATHLEPGVVQADSEPTTGVLDIGRYPAGTDELCERVSAALAASTFSSHPSADVMRHKYTKLLVMNLGNAAQAICGPGAATGELIRRARQEAVACFEAAGIDYASEAEDRERRGNLITIRPIGDKPRAGGSTWQSLARGKRELEVDYLNGEIALLGRLHGVPTPVNSAFQRIANQMAANGTPPGSITPEELEHAIG